MCSVLLQNQKTLLVPVELAYAATPQTQRQYQYKTQYKVKIKLYRKCLVVSLESQGDLWTIQHV